MDGALALADGRLEGEEADERHAERSQVVEEGNGGEVGADVCVGGGEKAYARSCSRRRGCA